MSSGWLPDVVVLDRGSHGHEPLGDGGGDPGRGASAVWFVVELADDIRYGDVYFEWVSNFRACGTLRN